MNDASIKVGTFYLGGSFRRTWYLNQLIDGSVILSGYNGGGSFHASTTNIREELEHADSRLPDNPEECREHHAFAAAVRDGLATLAIPDPTRS